MLELGVVDSFNVVKTVLEDALSLAGLILTTECITVREKTFKRKLLLT